MKSLHKFVISVTAYFFIVLFCYAAVSKLLDFENFQIQLAQSPLLSAYAGLVSYGVILLELGISLALVIPKGRKVGLYLTVGLMVAFTVYIYLTLNFSDFVPCSCGGILENMSWSEHLIFNGCCVGVGLLSVILAEQEEGNLPSRTLALSSLIVLISGGSMVILFLSSEYLIKKENNFTRRFLPHPITEEGRYKLDFDSYYIAGQNNGQIYLGNSTSPLLLRVFNKKLTKNHLINLQRPKEDFLFSASKIQVHDPYFYLYDGTVPVIYRGKIQSTEIKVISYRDAYFNQLVVLDSNRFAVRSIVADPKHFALGEINEKNLRRFSLHDQLLPRNGTSLFETDGSFIGDEDREKFVYVYRYQNKFEVIDRDMRHKKQFKTIDTTEYRPLDVKILENGDKRFQNPPPIINKKCFLHDGVLFMESNVRGKFESKKSWKKTSVIDLYSTKEEAYLGSLYIYRRGKGTLADVLVTNDQLFVIMGNELISYRMSLSITKYFRTGEAENLKTE